MAGAADRVFALVEKVIESGYDLRTFHKRLIEHFRDLLIVRTMSAPGGSSIYGEPDLAAFGRSRKKRGRRTFCAIFRPFRTAKGA